MEVTLCVPSPLFQAKNQTTVASSAEMTVDEHSLTSYIWACFSWWIPTLCLYSIVSPKSDRQKNNVTKDCFQTSGHLFARGPRNTQTVLYRWSETASCLRVPMGDIGFHLLVLGLNTSPLFRCSLPSWPPTAYSIPGKMNVLSCKCVSW